MFGKLFNKAKVIKNENLMQAIVAACLLMAAADGSISGDEVSKLEKLLNSNDNLSAFKGSAISKTIARYRQLLEADFDVGKAKLLREIAEVSGSDEDSEDVFLNAMAIAKADGDISEKELLVAKAVASELNISLEQYGLGRS